MTHIMQTTVTNGIASGARISAQPVAGKTGTTSERYNIWFCGLTPQYSAAIWVGNDVNIPLNRGSDAATALWSKIMQRVMADIPREEFVMKGEFVNATVDRISGKLPTSLSQADTRGTLVSDIFIKGTVPSEQDDAHVTVTVCAETGYLATPYCTHTVNKLAVIRPGGMSWEKTLATYPMSSVSIRSIPDAIYDAPDYYCPVHNPDPAFYPVSPLASEQKGSNPLDMDPVETPNGSENGNGSGNGNGSENGNGNGDGPSEGEDDPGTGGTEDESH
jgi:penicillin-binding protein 1A